MGSRLLRRMLIRTALFPLVFASLLALVFLGQIHHLLGVTHSVDRTDRILAEAYHAERMLVDMETGQRGYLVTGAPDFLAPYLDAGKAIGGTLEGLEPLVQQPYPSQVERLRRVRRQVDEWRAYSERVRRLRDTGGDYRNLVLSRQGKKLMDAMRREMAEFISVEQHLRAQRVAVAQATTTWVTASSLGLAALVGIVLAFLMPREIRTISNTYEKALREREAAETKLKEINTELERRVEQRTANLQEANASLAAENRERRRAEAELRDLAARLQRSNRELEEFANVASHDLQEPLRKVQAFGDRLQAKCADALTDEGRGYLERMQGAAARMQNLIRDLLSFSRVTTKAQPFVPVDLGEVAHEAVSDLEARIEATGGRVEIAPLPTVEADRLQMGQLLQNLIGNALKFHRPDVPPVVRVRSGEAPQAGLCTTVIEDNGIGFEEKYLDRIFVPFQRLHDRGAYEGTGIGLAISRKIVERHGGSLTARSTPGEGSVFIVTLPLCQPKERPPECPGEDSASSS